MKIFSILLCLIPLCFCSKLKRRLISEQSQDLLAIAFSKGAFQNVPDEILQHILYYLPLKYQQSFSCVNQFWSYKFNFFRNANLNYSMNIFLKTTSLPSEVPFEELLKVIDCFIGYWENLCRNSKNANFINERFQLETKLGNWLSANMNQITSLEWNTLLNKEEDTFSYILLQRLLFSHYFYFTLNHPIWKAMAAHNEIRIRVACDFISQVPMILGKAAVGYFIGCIGNSKEIFQLAIQRGIELELDYFNADGFLYTTIIYQKSKLLEDIHTEVQSLAHHGIPTHILKLESIIVTEIEIGSIDIFKEGFFVKSINRNDADYKTKKDELILNGFKLAYIYSSSRQEMYTMPIVSFVNMENPAFLPFIFLKTLTTQTPNQPLILMYLCSSIPNAFDFYQINVIEIVTIIWPIVSVFLLPITLKTFREMAKETQIDVFKRIIKKKIDRLVFNWKAELIRESYACIEKELQNTALFFNAAPPVFPFVYHFTPTKSYEIANRIDLYFLIKIGIITEYEELMTSCGQIISAVGLESTLLSYRSRELTLPDESKISVYSGPTHAHFLEDSSSKSTSPESDESDESTSVEDGGDDESSNSE